MLIFFCGQCYIPTPWRKMMNKIDVCFCVCLCVFQIIWNDDDVCVCTLYIVGWFQKKCLLHTERKQNIKLQFLWFFFSSLSISLNFFLSLSYSIYLSRSLFLFLYPSLVNGRRDLPKCDKRSSCVVLFVMKNVNINRMLQLLSTAENN